MEMLECLRAAPGVSCVETYLIALARLEGRDEAALYGDSYLGLAATVNDFLAGGKTYAAYTGMPRLQNTAREAGLMELASDFCALKYRRFDHYLFGVRPGYRESGPALWRDDHYLLKHNGRFYDCDPPSALNGFDERFLDGRVLGMRLIGDWSRDRAEEKLAAAIQAARPAPLRFPLREDALIPVRDALLILKASRERVYRLFPSDALAELIERLARLAALLEAFRLRRRMRECGAETERISLLETIWIENGSKRS